MQIIQVKENRQKSLVLRKCMGRNLNQPATANLEVCHFFHPPASVGTLARLKNLERYRLGPPH